MTHVDHGAESAKAGLPRSSPWRLFVLVLVVFGSLAWMLSTDAYGQDPAYHDFADGRGWFGVPNFLNVATNSLFLIVGIWGVRQSRLIEAPSLRAAWMTFSVGVGLVALGSGYYHLSPDNASLVWDRLPMTIGFMGLLVAVLTEHLGDGFGRYLLVPAILVGFSSVVYWSVFDDLRFYYWVQLVPLLVIPTLFVLFKSGYTHRPMLLLALALYFAAKFVEARDAAVLAASGGALSGHSLKHVLAAAGCSTIILMLVSRRRVMITAVE